MCYGEMANRSQQPNVAKASFELASNNIGAKVKLLLRRLQTNKTNQPLLLAVPFKAMDSKDLISIYA